MNRPEWHWAIVGCASSAGLGIIMPAFALALSNVLGVFYNPDHAKMKSVIQTWCIVFGAVGGGALVCGTLQSYSFSLMGQKLAKRIRLMLMQALLKQVCCAVLCCAVLCCAVLCCAVLCCAAPCWAIMSAWWCYHVTSHATLIPQHSGFEHAATPSMHVFGDHAPFADKAGMYWTTLCWHMWTVVFQT
jgi:hypothetical protein